MPIRSSIIITPEPKNLPGAWLVVALLFVVGALNYLDRIIITTMRVSIIETIPMTDAQFGLLTSTFLWVYGLLSPFAGFLADRINRSRVIIGSLFVWSSVTWLTAHVTTFEQLLATRALMGISEACYIPAALALIVDYHRGATRSLAIGINMAGIMVGSSLGFIGGWIAEKHNWNDAFSILGVIGIIFSIVLTFKLRDAPKNENKVVTAKKPININLLEAGKDLFKSRSFILMLVYWSLLGVVGWMIIGWLPTYYQEHFNLSQGLSGLYATGYLYPVSFIGVILGGYLADRWGRINSRSIILVPFIGLCVAAPAIFLASSTSILPLTIICFMLYGLTRMFSDANMMPILCLVADPRYRATGYGVLNMFSCFIGGIGLYAGGVLRDSDINLNLMFRVAAILLFLCAAFLYKVKLAGKPN